MKIYQKIKSLIPQKFRSKIFWGVIKLRETLITHLEPATSYITSYAKVKLFLLCLPPKKISAMLRVKNEEEFLMSAVLSIIDCVDEIIIVDNQSSDKTHGIIQKLIKRFPDKIFSYEYRHPIAKIGTESEKLAYHDRNSPSHIANFTNWCMTKCTQPYILHWAGDHIATDDLHKAIGKFKKSSHQLYRSVGINIYPDFKHSVKTIEDKKRLGAAFFPDSLENYLSEKTFPEIRIFPKKFSHHFSGDFPYLENFYSPFLKFTKYIFYDKNISYLHLKFCKKNPYQIMSQDMRKVISKNIIMGKRLEKKYIATLRKLGIK